MERKTTSIKVSPEIWKQVKVHCAKQETEICDYIEGLIRQNLNKGGTKCQ